MVRSLALVALFVVSGFARAGDIQQLLQLVDYVGVDYGEAVADGQVINPAEYAEMLDFSAGIERHTAELPAGKRVNVCSSRPKRCLNLFWRRWRQPESAN